MKAFMVLASTALLGAALIVPTASPGHGMGSHGDGGEPCENPTIVAGSDGGVTFGTSGRDIIRGSNGPDTIYAKGGHDHVCGNRGPDTVVGNKDDDVLYGNHGSDVVRGGGGFDKAHGGPSGSDTCKSSERLKACELS
jgi:Ca2+-binding RTX toxin-like protein